MVYGVVFSAYVVIQCVITTCTCRYDHVCNAHYVAKPVVCAIHVPLHVHVFYTLHFRCYVFIRCKRTVHVHVYIVCFRLVPVRLGVSCSRTLP